MPQPMDDLRFNRKRRKGVHAYLDTFDSSRRKSGTRSYPGYLKCKLVHGVGYSLIVPDQVYIELGGTLEWIQPLFFTGNLIAKLHDSTVCKIGIDISHGIAIHVEFRSDSVVSRLPDGSYLYRCSIAGPDLLHRYTTGPARLENGSPMVKLFHHTSSAAKKAIQADGSFRTSDWNIQGNKRCLNTSFLYLTPLPELIHPSDLQQIAMSTSGQISLRLDQNMTNTPDLVLPVYRESTSNRTSTLSAWVHAADLAPQPCYRHRPPGSFPYHEMVAPYIHRIPSEPGEKVAISGNSLRPERLKVLTHAVVGDATTIDGLIAPYDEEETAELLKVETVDTPNDLLSFWMSKRNQDHYSGRSTEPLVFK